MRYFHSILLTLVCLFIAISGFGQTRVRSSAERGNNSSDTQTIDFRDKTHSDSSAENDEDDGYIKKKKKVIKSEVKTWKMNDEYLALVDTCQVDTAIVNYQNNDPVIKFGIANSYNGNLGSPIQSKIYFDNKAPKTDFLFSRAYDLYTITPKDINFYNTKTPFAILTYRTGGASYHEEDYLKGLFTFNVNKRVNVGLLANLIYARGTYSNQASRLFNGGLWASYNGKHYTCNGAIILNHFNYHENGGITDERFITNPSAVSAASIQAANIPTNLTDAYNMYKNDIYYYNHKYRWGYEKEIQVTEDSTTTEFIPVMGIAHTIKFEHARRRYYEDGDINTDFYPINYLNDDYTNDSTSYLSLKNQLSFIMEEEFNKVLKFGLAAYAQHEWQRHEMYIDTIPNRVYYNNIKVGGAIFKETGDVFKYRVKGDVYVLGDRIGDFNVDGNFNTFFSTPDTNMYIEVHGGINNSKPTYFLRDYISNHFQWRNSDFKGTIRSGVGGKFIYPNKYVGIKLGVDFENVTRLIYFDENALPQQHSGNVQVINATGSINFHAWRFHLENDVAYQFSSNKEVLPLPDVALFSNFYYKDLFFKVLTFQLGVSVRYHTKYYAPSFMPATGQFYNQNQTLIGNYPFLSAYVNCHLKKVRFFVQVHNILESLVNDKCYFSMPNYPLSGLTVRFGLSWAFYD